MILLYDGSYYGFLSCIHEHYYGRKATEIFPKALFQGSIVDEAYDVITDEEKAAKVEKALSEKFSMIGYLDMYRCFLSNDMNKDTWNLKYIQKGFKIGEKLDRLYSDPDVIHIRKLSRQVGFEGHRFKGILRFEERNGFLYARYEPDHDISELIADHFADRFLNEQIIIHDLKRHKAVLAKGGKWIITEVTPNSNIHDLSQINLTQEEELLQNLWKGYFEHIGIEGRKNPKLQQNFVPLKYRKHMLDFE